MQKTYQSLFKFSLLLVLGLAYAFLYLPILHVGFASVSSNVSYPYPPDWNFAAYGRLLLSSVYGSAFVNSAIIGLTSATVSTLLALLAALAILKGNRRFLPWILPVFLAPIFVPEILLGIASMVFNSLVLKLQGNLISAILANAVHCFSYALIIIFTQFFSYDWRLNEAAMVFGATPRRTFLEVTLPLVWPGLLAAFIVSFILAFNNLEVSFYLLGATPTLPSVAWGSLRFGLRSELFALATLVNIVIFVVLAVMYALMRTGTMKFGYREETDSIRG